LHIQNFFLNYFFSNFKLAYINSKNILEINPSHPAIKELLERVKDEPNTETKDLAVLLYEGAMINSGKLFFFFFQLKLIKKKFFYQGY
jgi:HSP90 family molecular chaperone